MYFCYIDESGTPDIPGTTNHYILAGLSIPVFCWKGFDAQISAFKAKWGLADSELHVAWLLRSMVEQSKIPDFDKLSYADRRSKVMYLRNTEILRLQKENPKALPQIRKNHRNTEPYIHLTREERKNVILQFAELVGRWTHARLFAECVDKCYFASKHLGESIAEKAFEQLVSRFDSYLHITSAGQDSKNMGLLIHDHNQTVAQKLRALMLRFHQSGTAWREITHIIETPLFVDSKLTSMVQVADLCGYALRRFLENGETELFDRIYVRADKKDGKVVGVRHYTDTSKPCMCKICASRMFPPVSGR